MPLLSVGGSCSGAGGVHFPVSRQALFDLVRALLIDRDQRAVTEAELRAVLRACG